MQSLRSLSVLLALALAVYALAVHGAPAPPPPYTNVPALIEGQGYAVQEHSVTTADGFVLVMFRVAPTASDFSIAGRPVVMLQHGVLDAASTWFINLKNESLGFILATLGYDVWATNTRTNGQSWLAVNCSCTRDCFWANSFDQMALFDLPAMIDYVLAQTGASNLAYVGHSQGTMIAFAQLSLSAALAEKISIFVALAPVARVGHATAGILQDLAKVPDSLVYDAVGSKEFTLDPAFLKKLFPVLCEAKPSICLDAICDIAGCAQSNLNESRFDVLFQYYPAPTSVQDMVHFSQLVRSDQFQMYNYGSASANEAHYGTATPPVYNVSAFAGRVALLSGTLDKLADPTDVAWLASQLPPESLVFQKTYPIGHGGFVWGLEAASTVYADTIALIRKYS